MAKTWSSSRRGSASSSVLGNNGADVTTGVVERLSAHLRRRCRRCGTSPFADAPRMRSAVWMERRLRAEAATRRSWRGGCERRRGGGWWREFKEADNGMIELKLTTRSTRLLVVVALLLCAGCAKRSNSYLEESARCGRYGGTWMGTSCSAQ